VASQPESELFAEAMQHFSDKFDDLCAERHKAGQAEYGAFTFLGNDVIRMMMEELADTSNYCRMQFIKLMFLQAHLANELEDVVDEDETINIGLKAFKGTKTGWGDHDG
jgi:hypothetical protein